MLSIPDMALLGAAALLLFGPEQLPRVARKAGNVMREIQNTSSSFIRELERAADVSEALHPSVYEPVTPYEPAATPYEPPAPDPTPYDVLHEPAAEASANGRSADEHLAHESVMHAFSAHQPPVYESPQAGAAEPVEARAAEPAEPSADLERAESEGLHAAEPMPYLAEPEHPAPEPELRAAEAAPESDHPPHV